MPHIKFVYNPLHYQGDNNRLAGLKEILKKSVFPVVYIPLEKNDSTKRFLLSELDDTRAVIIAGGDGTLNIAINILLQGQREENLPPLAVLPGGTANDFAGQLTGGNIDYTLEDLLLAIEDNKTCLADVGKVNGRYFINVVGAGLLVDVAHNTSDNLKQKWGMMAYYYEGLKNFFSYHPFKLIINENNVALEEEALLVLVLNSRGAGGFSRLAPSASFNDGKLDLLVLRNTGSAAGMVSMLSRFIRGEHLEGERLLYRQVKSVELDAPHGVTTDIDGEPGPSFPLTINVHPGKLRFLLVERAGGELPQNEQ